MDDFSGLGTEERRRLREAFLQEAAAAFDAMFDPERQDQLVTLTQREDEACALGRKLTAQLLQDHVAGDPHVQPSGSGAIVCCPKCKGAGQRVTEPGQALPERRLTTRAGEVTLHREQWRCTRCRIVFFSARPPAAIRHGRVQSAAAAEGGASGGQGVV